MAASPPLTESQTTTSSASAGRASQSLQRDGNGDDAHREDDVSVEALVEHLLAAKRSLSSVQHVLRANDLTTHARQAHEESAMLSAHTAMLHRAIAKQMSLLLRVRRGLKQTYDAGRRDFASLVRTMDATNEKLQETIDVLRATPVDATLRPADEEEEKSLMDFVDEQGVHSVVEALKQSLAELQARPIPLSFVLCADRITQGIQTSFDGDLLRFDDDMRVVKQSMTATATSPDKSPSASDVNQKLSDLLLSLTDHSHNMAQLLASLTQHFDLCVTAVRTTEGGAALARRRAAESTHSQDGDGVSISGVIADQEMHTSELEPITSRDRADMVDIVVGDASEVEGVVQEISDRLRHAEADFHALTVRAESTRTAHAAASTALQVLEELSSRLAGYVAAEAEFIQRWEDERYTIYGKLEEMEALRKFYDGYAGAYDAILLEAERRRLAEDKALAIWRRAKEGVDKLVEADRRDREAFRHDVAEFIPNDLWPGMDAPVKRWQLVGGEGSPAALLDQQAVDAARKRMEQRRMEES
ncbi:autophagy-related protein 17 [Plectosphaerella plurivora]|uniref:Autophagy-related protein 17 n=1 Tax=Plectosphaerella plurivora TaxID=936078 RepID=A0A9P8VIR5_9PEZI|nr:autophagy-related protein 17 [Plectosphaerella plurivora]